MVSRETFLTQNSRGAHAAVLGLTAFRLIFLYPVIWGIQNNPPLAVAAIVAIACTDLLDGVFARETGLDGPKRRLMDAGIDRVTIHGACLAIVLVHPTLLLLYAPLAARDGGMAFVDIWCLQTRSTHIAGSKIHRCSSASIAILGVIALTCGVGITIVAAVVAWLINYVLLLDYLPALRAVIAAPQSAGLRVVRTCEKRPVLLAKRFSPI